MEIFELFNMAAPAAVICGLLFLVVFIITTLIEQGGTHADKD